MIFRLVIFFALLSATALPQGRPVFGKPKTVPPKPKVIAPPPAAVPVKPKPKAPAKRKPAVKPKDPLAQYMPKVKEVFASRWMDAAAPRLGDFESGTVEVAFELDADGKVLEVRVTESSSNEAFAKFCEQFVKETNFEKPPAAVLVEGRVKIPFTFKVY